MLRYFHEHGRRLFSYRETILLIVVLSMSVVQNIPTRFNHNLSGLDARTHTHHRQCFDHEDSLCLPCPSSILATVLPFVSRDATPNAELLVEILTDGLPYNRPPPVS
jgi:hypothetical protein